MKKKKVTNLEKFALEQIFRPYQTMLGFEKRLEKLPFSIDEIPNLMANNPEWASVVLDRIKRIGFYFPVYIKHDIVRIIKTGRD